MMSRVKSIFKDGILPFAIMLITMLLSIVLFRITRASNTTEFQASFDVAGEETNPTFGRLSYLIVSFVLSMIFVITAYKLHKRNSDSLILPWTLGVTGGTMLWQCIGESMWHFGLTIMNDEGELGFANFPRIESIQGLPFLILVLILFFSMRTKLGFGVASWLVAFLGNWVGHFVMIGTFPIAMALGYTGDMASWYRLSGLIGTILFGIMGLGLLCSNTKRENKYLASACLFIAAGCLFYGVIKNET